MDIDDRCASQLHLAGVRISAESRARAALRVLFGFFARAAVSSRLTANRIITRALIPLSP
jgi:hypothetical protein